MSRSLTAACLSIVPTLALLGGCTVSPVPLSETDLVASARIRVDAVGSVVPDRVLTISLYEAVARALKHNFDHHVESYQVALRSVESRAVATQGLPSLVANASYASRSNDLASGSLELVPPPLPLTAYTEPDSVSSDRDVGTQDLSLSWNLLDLALSYARATQSADRVLIAQEQRRRIVQRLIEDTRAAYWRALSHERTSLRLAALDERAARAIQRTKRAAREGAETPMTALSYERELTQIRQTAEKLQHELALAKSQLAALMNLPPGVQFKLLDKIEVPDESVVGMGVNAMIADAIYNRPELREIAYQVRINETEVQAAFFEVLPALRLTVSRNFSDDHFLLHENWLTVGASAAGNLLKVFQLPARRATIDAEKELLEAKALATTLAIITQVHISRIRYQHGRVLLDTAREYQDVQNKLVRHLRFEKAADLIGEQTLLREEMNLLVGEIQSDIAIANVLSASASMMTTLGYDMQGRDLDLTADLATIAAEIGANWSRRSVLSDRHLYLAELAKARAEAKRRAELEERRRREEAARERAEQARLAKMLASEAQKARREVREGLKAEAAKRRANVLETRRRPALKANTQPAAPTVTFWPFDGVASPAPKAPSPPKIYTGTK